MDALDDVRLNLNLQEHSSDDQHYILQIKQVAKSTHLCVDSLLMNYLLKFIFFLGPEVL